MYKNENPILERNFICKVCTIVLENWAFLWLWKVLFLVSMGQNLLGKTIKSRTDHLKEPFLTSEKNEILKIWIWELVWSDSVSYVLVSPVSF